MRLLYDVSKKRMKFEARPCPICKGDDKLVLFRKENLDVTRLTDAAFSSRKLPEYMHCRLMKCTRCDLIVSTPAPSFDTLADSYRDATFEANKESEYAAKTYGAYLRRAAPQATGPAVDVGAGDGAFMRELLRTGFDDVIGFEPSEAPVRAANADIRDKIRPALFDASQFTNDAFGLITCFQTIEHVYDPLQLVSDMHRVLRKDGTAFLIAHDVDALSAKILGAKSPIFDIEHLQLFNRNSAEKLMATAGFRNVSIFPIFNSYPIAYWAKLFPVPAALKSRLLGALNGPLIWLGRRLLPLPAGNLAIVATK